MMQSNKRKLALSGYFKEQTEKVNGLYYGYFMLQHFLFMYETVSEIEHDTADFKSLSGSNTGSYFETVNEDWMNHGEEEFTKICEQTYKDNPSIINKNRAKRCCLIMASIGDVHDVYSFLENFDYKERLKKELKKLKNKTKIDMTKFHKFHNMTMTDTHVYFWRNNTPFSNFYKKPFHYKEKTLLFSEQAFMIEKALLFDPSKVDQIAAVKQPQDAKAIGRNIQNYDDTIWNQKRYDAMVKALKAKFTDPELREILLETGDLTLVEASPYDRIWGVGLSEDDNELYTGDWRGQNLLGKALMEVRDKIRHELWLSGK